MNKPTNVAADLDAPSSLSTTGVNAISAALNVLLADAFALYLKTKNFHWHVSGRHFRDYHLMLDERTEAIFETTDQLAERVRKIGGVTIRSIGQIARLQTITNNDEEFVAPSGDAARAHGGQQAGRRSHAQGARTVRRARRRGDRQPARKFHRRDRAAHLVPVRGVAAVRRQRRIGNRELGQARGGDLR